MEFDWGIAINGNVLRSFVIFSKDKPRMTSRRDIVESYAMCREECMNNPACTGVMVKNIFTLNK